MREHHPEPLEIAVDRLAEANLELVRVVKHLTNPKHQRHPVRLVFTTNINNNQFIIMALQLNANQFSIETLQLIDSDTGLPVAATFSNVVFTSSDPNVFTTTPVPGNPAQTRDDAVGAGTATLNVTADVTYTDSVSNQPVTKSLISNVPVVVTKAAAENVALQIVVGTPQNK